MGIIGLIVGYFFGLIAYIVLVFSLGPWVDTVAALQSVVWAILGAWWAGKGFPLRRE